MDLLGGLGELKDGDANSSSRTSKKKEKVVKAICKLATHQQGEKRGTYSGKVFYAIACVFEENAALKTFAKTQIPGAQMRWIPDWNMWALHIPTAPMARDFHAALLADKSMAATAAKVNRALDISPYRDPAATKYKFTLASSELQFETVADGLLDRSIMIVGNVYHFKELLKARFPQIKYLDLVFNNGDTIKAAWVLPESAQTKDTGTLAEYLTSLGVEVSEIDLDEEEDDDDDSDLDDDDLIDAEAEEAGEEEEEE